MKLVELDRLKVIYTCNAKEVLTPEQLKLEVQDEVRASHLATAAPPSHTHSEHEMVPRCNGIEDRACLCCVLCVVVGGGGWSCAAVGPTAHHQRRHGIPREGSAANHTGGIAHTLTTYWPTGG